jgi:hypothetical protein
VCEFVREFVRVCAHVCARAYERVRVRARAENVRRTSGSSQLISASERSRVKRSSALNGCKTKTHKQTNRPRKQNKQAGRDAARRHAGRAPNVAPPRCSRLGGAAAPSGARRAERRVLEMRRVDLQVSETQAAQRAERRHPRGTEHVGRACAVRVSLYMYVYLCRYARANAAFRDEFERIAFGRFAPTSQC